MLSATVIWTKALAALKSEMTDASYNTWVRELVPIAVEDEKTLVLQTEGDLFCSTLDRFYKTTVEKSIREATGYELSVRFVTPETEIEEMYTNTISPSDIVKPKTVSCDCPSLIPKYTFDTFVTGESNRFSYAAALAVAENPSKAYNPLYIYGGVGLGKTHLMHAIGHYIHGEHPEYKILYITSENFTNDVVQSIAKKERTVLREKYRTLDVLLIDDIQFIAGKEATEMEFFNVFNHLRDADKQIIITSDKPPKDIPILEERLKTRFGWGLITDIQPPDFETRAAILRRKATQDNIDVSNEVLAVIAERVYSNIRDLEGCLNKVVAYAKFIKKPITASLVENVLKDYVSDSDAPRPATMDRVRQVACDYFNVTQSEMESNRRERRVAFPRQIAMYLSRTIVNASFPEIGSFYGGRHYSTVMYACDQIEKQIETDIELKNTVDDLTEKIKNG
ncbi:MAG: chromosomal replication initiator protein DnaA [Christensenellaceae bacterium]|nr:chromosomal replication initiator protein DnaA [Christensenellaceae bacterium]